MMVGTIRLRRASRALLATLVVTGAAGVIASPAGATKVEYKDVNCTAVLNGTPIAQKQNVTVNVEMPAQAFAGQEFTITFPGGEATLPDKALGVIGITQYTNLSTSYKVTGATLVPGSVASNGQATNNGNPVVGGTAEVIGTDIFKSSTPGPVFPGQLVTPTTTVKAIAGPAGTTITIAGETLTTTAHLATPPGQVTPAAVTCDIPKDVITSSNSVAAPPPPPPPGAPTAANVTTSAGPGQSVTLDVLATSVTPPAGGSVDPASLSIKTAPTKGTAVVQSGKIVYTANGNATGGDTFQYEVCATAAPATTTTAAPTTTTPPSSTPITQVSGVRNLPELDFISFRSQTAFGPCHFANVTVTISSPPATQAAPTTAAAAPAATLPETGDASWMFALAGVALLAAGALAVGWSRRRSAPAR